jgi:hypothetical protein
MKIEVEAEITAIKVILANVVARLAITRAAEEPDKVRAVLEQMKDECKLAAEKGTLASTPAEQARLVNTTLMHINEFFKSITIT